MQQEAEHFDPYQILDLPLKANATEIKSKYRRLSLKYHPDKNPGTRREAEKKFDQVAKAYKVGIGCGVLPIGWGRYIMGRRVCGLSTSE